MSTITARRVAKAAEAQQAGIVLAIARGDTAEEQRRRIAHWRLMNRQSRAERSAVEFQALIVRLSRDAERVGKVDWLARLAAEPRNGIGDAHMRAAECLRDHMEFALSGRSELRERVDGGNIHNGQMEGMCDRRRPMRFAMNAAMEAVTDQRLLRGVVAVIIEKHSVPKALAACGFSKTGRMHARLVDGIVEALDAAAAHIGVAS